MKRHHIIKKEIEAAAKRWNVDPKDVITKRDKNRRCYTVPEYCARYDVILALRDQWFDNTTLARLFGYKNASSIPQLMKKFEKKTCHL